MPNSFTLLRSPALSVRSMNAERPSVSLALAVLRSAESAHCKRVCKERYLSASFGENLLPMRMNITLCKAVRKKSKYIKGMRRQILRVGICTLGRAVFGVF